MPKVLDPIDTKKIGVDSEHFEIKEKQKCSHGGNLIYVAASEAECTLCRFGMYLGEGDFIKHGHLYHGSKLVL